MNCLCCGKSLTAAEMESGWHKRCIRSFFGTSVLPEIAINEEVMSRIAVENSRKGLTIPGVQKKLSLHLKSGAGKTRLMVVNYPSGYILKPQVEEFAALPEAEQLVMSMADVAGIKTVPHALLKGEDGFAYITRRIDRRISKDEVGMLAMEDFCQLDLRPTRDKYKGSYERCGKIVQRYSSRAGLDMTEVFLRIAFSFLVGNSDMHLKNFSLIETDIRSNAYILSPAYDLLPVNLVMPEDEEQFALSLNGKKKNIHKKDFLSFAASCELPDKAAERMLARLCELRPVFTAMCRESLLPDEMKTGFLALMEERWQAMQ